MNIIDQNRGGRNPSYKQMNIVQQNYAQAYFRFLRMLNTTSWTDVIPRNFATSVNMQLDSLWIDWYYMFLSSYKRYAYF